MPRPDRIVCLVLRLLPPRLHRRSPSNAPNRRPLSQRPPNRNARQRCHRGPASPLPATMRSPVRPRLSKYPPNRKTHPRCPPRSLTPILAMVLRSARSPPRRTPSRPPNRRARASWRHLIARSRSPRERLHQLCRPGRRRRSLDQPSARPGQLSLSSAMPLGMSFVPASVSAR
jgi:hypothetical protein